MGRETIIQLWEHFKGFDEIWIIARRRERLDELDRQVGCPCANLHWILQGSVTGTCSCGH